MSFVRIDINFLDRKYTAEIDYRVTYRGHAGTYYEPGEPFEYEIEYLSLFDKEENLELPEWLNDHMIDYLSCSQDVYDKIADEEYRW